MTFTQLCDAMTTAGLLPAEYAELSRVARTLSAQRGQTSFRRGQRVKFFATAYNQYVTGTIARLNQKSVTLEQCQKTDGTASVGWRVGYAMLEPAV